MEATTASFPPSLPAPNVSRGIFSAALLTVIADNLFWRAPVGASLGIFACIAAGLHIAAQPAASWSRRRWLLLAALCLTAIQSAVEISLSNVLVLGALLIWLMGESCFGHLPSAWARWLEAQVALLRAPTRWRWLWSKVDRSSYAETLAQHAPPGRIKQIAQIVAPALFLGGFFLMILCSGNAMLRDVLETLSSRFAEWITSFDLSFGRLLFWLVVSSIALAWFQPARDAVARWAWAGSWPTWRRADEVVAKWQSRAVLLMLNVIFFAANTLDVVYLWLNAKLPHEVTPSQYVHSGVGSLILAVLLSAVVLVTLFQQEDTVSRARGVRGLAYVWIAQNIILIAGVCMRLRLYVEAYHWSELRVYVGCFLLLVATGFGLLVWKIVRSRSLGWLVLGNFLATLALFFTLQFVDVAGWVAQANVNQWERNPARVLDLEYLKTLGPNAWPALLRVANSTRSPETAAAARTELSEQAAIQRKRLPGVDWRSWQARRDWLARKLVEQMPPLEMVIW